MLIRIVRAVGNGNGKGQASLLMVAFANDYISIILVFVGAND